MKKVTLYFLLFLSISVYSQHKSDNLKITTDLLETMANTSSEEMIPINIVLRDKYPTSLFTSRISDFNISDKREFVKRELMSFSEKSQKKLISFLSEKENNVEIDHCFWITNVISCKASKTVIIELSKREDIERIDHDEVRNMFLDNEEAGLFIPAPIYEPEEITYNVNKVNAPDVWSLGYKGNGIIVAVLDAGINYYHVDLADHMWNHPNYPNHGYNFAYDNNDPMDFHGHGTHCAGTIAGDGTAGSQTGVAPESTIMALKVIDDQGYGQESDVWEGIEFAVNFGADILSMSIGWHHSSNPDRATWRNTLNNALAAGLVASIAAGNLAGSPGTSNDVTTPGDCPPPWLNPDQTLLGGLSACISVGATDINDSIADFSSRGPSTWDTVSPFNDYPFNPMMGLLRPDVSAPGVDIISCDADNINGYTIRSGTSMATPCVAGIMALLKSRKPTITPQEIDIALETKAIDLGAMGKDNIYGAGRVDALESILSTIEILPPLNLQVNIDQETAKAILSWDPNTGLGFQYFIIYRDNVEIGTTVLTNFEELLPEYGYYTYSVTSYYGNDNESDPTTAQTQWGSSTIEVNQSSFNVNIYPDSTVEKTMIIKNTGVLDLTYAVSYSSNNNDTIEWVTVIPDNAIIGVGDSLSVNLVFNSQGYNTGVYNDILHLTTNDLITPDFYINLTMIVSDIEVSITADPSIICSGDSSILNTNITGGTGNFTYFWMSDPVGFTSTEPNPIVFPSENTMYNLLIIDTNISIKASVSVNVMALPEINLGVDTAICGDVSITLDAYNPSSTYLWSTGETSRTIVADTLAFGYGIHNFSVEVTSENGCTNDAGVNIEFVNCTGMDELSSVDMKIYPNPSVGIFNLELMGESNQPVDVKVMSVSGTVIYSIDNITVSGLTFQKIDISNFADGVYTVSISNNGVSKTQRIVLRK